LDDYRYGHDDSLQYLPPPKSVATIRLNLHHHPPLNDGFDDDRFDEAARNLAMEAAKVVAMEAAKLVAAKVVAKLVAAKAISAAARAVEKKKAAMQGLGQRFANRHMAQNVQDSQE
jgi:hypothetical protein